MSRRAIELRLPATGAGGEPVDLDRAIRSHGLTALPPFSVLDGGSRLRAAVRLGPRPATLELSAAGAHITVSARLARGTPEPAGVERAVRRLLSLDDDLRPFYERAAEDPDLAWATDGAGRLVRSATVFEEVVKTICTTNCSWSATTRMLTALVAELGQPAGDNELRTFPSAGDMADVEPAFYSQTMRAGYRGAYLQALARDVASGAVDLEELRASAAGLTDDDVERRLRALPGVGPYAAAHIMLLIGRPSRLVLDSWTRPAYARLVGRTSVTDRSIRRRFARYGPYAGLAFWLFVTRDSVAER